MNQTPKYVIVDGFRLPPRFSAIGYHSGVAYEPRPDDLFVATYPKCGTTWMQQIVRLIYHNGKPFSSCLNFHLSSPNIELFGADSVQNMERPNAIKTHLPFDRVPYSDKAKYIYVARNPRDCCVSFFHHTKLLTNYGFSGGTFDIFFDLFLNGETDFGDYFHHLISWYKQSERPNVLFLTYENLKRNTESEILKVAKLMGRDLENDPNLLKTVIYKSSFDYMKENQHLYFTNANKVFVDAYNRGIQLPTGLKEFAHNLISEKVPLESAGKEFLRKGEVGTWKELFTEEQERRLEERIDEIRKDCDVMKLWDSA